MITNLKSTLDVISLAGDFLTLLPALNHRQTPPAHTGGLSFFSGTLKTSGHSILSSHVCLDKPSCTRAQILLLPSSYSRSIPFDLWPLFPLSSHLLRWYCYHPPSLPSPVCSDGPSHLDPAQQHFSSNLFQQKQKTFSLKATPTSTVATFRARPDCSVDWVLRHPLPRVKSTLKQGTEGPTELWAVGDDSFSSLFQTVKY